MGILIKEVTTGQSRRQVYNIKSNLLKFYYEVMLEHYLFLFHQLS